jgi:hypothetical protein
MRHCLPHSPKSNEALHRIAALLRFCLAPKVYGWATRGELLRYAADSLVEKVKFLSYSQVV